MLNLILRFYDADSGRILIDDQNIIDVSRHSLRQEIALVSQIGHGEKKEIWWKAAKTFRPRQQPCRGRR